MFQQSLDNAIGEYAARAPDEMKSRHGIAWRIQASLDPHRHGHEADAECAEPIVDIRYAAFDICLRPGERPFVSGLEFAKREPVGKAQFHAVLDAATPLQRRPRKPEPAEGVLRLAAEVLLDIPVDEHHPTAAVERLDGSDDAGDSRTGDRDVGGMATSAHDGVYSARSTTQGKDHGFAYACAAPDCGVARRFSDDERPGPGRSRYEERTGWLERSRRRRHPGRAGRRLRSREVRQTDGRDGRRRAAGLRDGRARALQPAIAGRSHPHDDPAVELLHRGSSAGRACRT